MAQYATVHDQQREEKIRRAGAGAMAGAVGGAAMGLLLMAVSSANGTGFWFPMLQTAVALFGIEALIGGLGTGLVGMGLHFTACVALGALFGVILPRVTTTGRALALGLLFGAATWVFLNYVALPIFNPALLERAALIPGYWFASHLVFGAALAATPNLARAFARAEVEEPIAPRLDQAA
jgi:hypothetical protein